MTRFSIELFPPRSVETEAAFGPVVSDLAASGPDFFSVTYGAGGSTKAETFAAISSIAERCAVPRLAHLTCVDASWEELHGVIAGQMARGATGFVVLRGDGSDGPGSPYRPHPDGPQRTDELVRAVREAGAEHAFVSAYPEVHPDSADLEADLVALKAKEDAGATGAITQFFFDVAQFSRYLDAVRAAGIRLPVIPGLIPVYNLKQLQRFARRCGATVPDAVARRFEGLEPGTEEHRRESVAHLCEMTDALCDLDIAHVHFYALNRVDVIPEVVYRSRLKSASQAA